MPHSPFNRSIVRLHRILTQRALYTTRPGGAAGSRHSGADMHYLSLEKTSVEDRSCSIQGQVDRLSDSSHFLPMNYINHWHAPNPRHASASWTIQGLIQHSM